MDADRKKQLRDAYKSKLAVGAVYAIDCSGNQRRLIKSTVDLAGIQNRFQFAMNINSCPDPLLREEWAKYGTASFTLVVLEELKMKEGQTGPEFAEEIKLLQELWQEKAAGQDQ